MAAILCESFSKMCSGACDAFGYILCAPCRFCGATCEITKDVICTPFFCYLAVVSCIMVPPICMTFAALADGAGLGCKLFIWLLINSALCVANILSAFHISKNILKDDIEIGGTEYKLSSSAKLSINDTNPGSSYRIQYVLCYDPITAVYLLLKAGFVIWQFVGVSWALAGDDACGISSYALYSAICGFSFISVAGCALVCSLCCLREHGNMSQSYGPRHTASAF